MDVSEKNNDDVDEDDDDDRPVLDPKILPPRPRRVRVGYVPPIRKRISSAVPLDSRDRRKDGCVTMDVKLCDMCRRRGRSVIGMSDKML